MDEHGLFGHPKMGSLYVQEAPIICSSTIGMTTNDNLIEFQIAAWAEGTEPIHDSGKDYQDLFTYYFVEQVLHLGGEFHIESMTRTAIPAEILQEEQEQDSLDSVKTAEDMDQGFQSEELISEQTLLDTVDLPGLPQQEADRRAAWRKLPQRVRVAVRCLHRRLHVGTLVDTVYWCILPRWKHPKPLDVLKLSRQRYVQRPNSKGLNKCKNTTARHSGFSPSQCVLEVKTQEELLAF